MSQNYSNKNEKNYEESPLYQLPIAEEKYSNLKIYDSQPINYKGSPFGERKEIRRKVGKEDGTLMNTLNQNDENPEYSEHSENLYKNKTNDKSNYNKNYKKMKTQPNIKPKLNFNKNKVNYNNDNNLLKEPNYPKFEENYDINNNPPPQYNNNIPNYSQIQQEDNYSDIKDQSFPQNNDNIEIPNPYPEFTDTLNHNRVEHKIHNRQKNIDENYSKKREDPRDTNKKKKHKSRKIKVEIAKTEPNYKYLDEYENGLKYLNESYNYNKSKDNLSNVSFSNKNIDTNKNKSFMTDQIDPNILNQFRLIKEIENNKKIKDLERQKEKLSRENKKLNKNLSSFEKEKEKFENEKRLFLESKNRVIDDTRKNEERLLKLENELQDKYMQKKNEIQEMKNKLRDEQDNLENERKNMHNTFQTKLDELENNFKIKEETQNYNINLNIDRAKKEQENLRKKEEEINNLKNLYKERENNLNMKENELKNKERDLQNKEYDLNNKYQDLLQKEKKLMNERERFLNNNEESQKDYNIKSQELRNKEEQLLNKENQLMDKEMQLKNKENEIKNKQNMINSQENELNNRQNQLNDRQNELNNKQNKLFSKQNEINDKEKQLDLLNKEIQDKQNKIIELNNQYNDIVSNMNSPSKQSPNNYLVPQNIEFDNNLITKPQETPKDDRPSITVKKIQRLNPNKNQNNDKINNNDVNIVETFGPIKESNISNSKSHYSDVQDNDNYPENQLNDIQDNDEYPENHLNDIQDNDNFPENHLHDIQDNDVYPENNGEDDFIVTDMNNNINNMNNDANNNNFNSNKNQSVNQNMNSMNKNFNNDLNDKNINNLNNKMNNMDNNIYNNIPPQNQFMDDEEFYGESPNDMDKQQDNNINNNLNNNPNNNKSQEEFGDIGDDFDNYINNQSNSQQLPENFHEKENKSFKDSNIQDQNMEMNNMDLPMDGELPEGNQQKDFSREEEQENTEMYNFGEENNNENEMEGGRFQDNFPGNDLPEKNLPKEPGNNLINSNNNLNNQNQGQPEENFSLDLSSKNNNMPSDFLENNTNKQNNDFNMNNIIHSNQNQQDIKASANSNLNNNFINNLESGEIDLKDLHQDDFDANGSNNNNIINNNENNLNNENQMDNDKENEINEITEELYIEEYNPSLGMTKVDNPNYMNAIVQCFAHIPCITDKIINLHFDENFKNELPNLKLSKAYRNLLINVFFPEKVYNMNRQSYNPSKFRNTLYQLNPLFQNNENVELKEFLNYMILKLHDELNTKKNNANTNDNIDQKVSLKSENDALVDFLQNFTTKNNSLISKNLYGLIKYQFYCHQCSKSFFDFQCYSYLHFNLEKVIEYKQNKYHKDDVEINLFDCLDYYQKPEALRGDNGLFCPSCQQQTESTSIRNIYSTKNVLIFILDRNIENNFNNCSIEFKETINLRDYVQYMKEGKKIREKFYLGGVVNFVGDNYGNETYNAFIKMGKNNDWYCYDDENVYPVSFQDIKNNGYPTVLFYIKLTQK